MASSISIFDVGSSPFDFVLFSLLIILSIPFFAFAAFLDSSPFFLTDFNFVDLVLDDLSSSLSSIIPSSEIATGASVTSTLLLSVGTQPIPSFLALFSLLVILSVPFFAFATFLGSCSFFLIEFNFVDLVLIDLSSSLSSIIPSSEIATGASVTSTLLLSVGAQPIPSSLARSPLPVTPDDTNTTNIKSSKEIRRLHPPMTARKPWEIVVLFMF